MTAVHAYTTGCRNSPGYWGRERTVFKSWEEHSRPCEQELCTWLSCLEPHVRTLPCKLLGVCGVQQRSVTGALPPGNAPV